MIAGRSIVLVAGYQLGYEVRAEIEDAGKLVIRVGRCDPAAVVRHVRDALLDPMPAPTTRSVVATSHKVPSSGPRQSAAGPLRCRLCGGRVELVSGCGPHAARANCRCGAWRWVSKADLQRAGIDAGTLSKVVDPPGGLGGEP